MSQLETALDTIKEWEYCYCQSCGKIRYSSELEATANGIRCRRCGSYSLEAPAWVICPHEKSQAVKCARAGKGIVHGAYGYECELRCNFRKS